MRGEGIEATKRALRACLLHLAEMSSKHKGRVHSLKQRMSVEGLLMPAADSCINFNIVGFGTSHRALFGDDSGWNGVSVDEANLAHAHQYVETLAADMGGTDLLVSVR